MGIKNLNKRLVEIGKIKIGGKNPDKQYKGKDGEMHRAPVKFDYFLVTDLSKDEKDNFIPNAEIMKKLGATPKELDIFLLSDDIDNNFMTSYALYQGNKCVCRGDGETATRKISKNKDGKELKEPYFTEVKCDPETCEFFKSGKCKPNGTLSVMLPQTEKIGGVYKFRTTSWNSIVNITSSLEAIKLMTGGVLFGLLLKMELIEKQTEEHGKIKVVNIVYAGSIEKLQIEAGKQKQLRLDGSVSMTEQNKLIKSSGILTPEDEPDEFYFEDETDEKGADPDILSAKIEETKPQKEPVKKEEKKQVIGNQLDIF